MSLSTRRAEAKWQKRELDQRRPEQSCCGCLHDMDVTPELVNEAERLAFVRKEKTNKQKAQNTCRKKTNAKDSSTRGRVVDWHGKTVFIDLSCSTRKRDVRSQCEAKGMRIVGERSKAQVAVVSKLSEPCQRTQLAVALGGGYLVIPSFAQYIKYKSALRTPRRLWIGRHFRTKCPTATGIISKMAEGTHWRIMLDFDKWNMAKRKAMASKNSQTVVALVVQKDLKEDFPDVEDPAKRHIFTREQFLSWVAVRELNFSNLTAIAMPLV